MINTNKYKCVNCEQKFDTNECVIETSIKINCYTHQNGFSPRNEDYKYDYREKIILFCEDCAKDFKEYIDIF